jgi:hypothetical protein
MKYQLYFKLKILCMELKNIQIMVPAIFFHQGTKVVFFFTSYLTSCLVHLANRIALLVAVLEPVHFIYTFHAHKRMSLV